MNSKVIWIAFYLAIAGNLTAQPTFQKPILFQLYGYVPASVLAEDDGYLIANWGYTKRSGTTAYRSGSILLKLDFSGDIEWEKIYSEPGKGMGLGEYGSLAAVPDGYLTCGNVVDSITKDSDFFLAKYDTAGDFQWIKKYPRAGTQTVFHGSLTADGGYIMIGEDFLVQPPADYFVIKTDSAGNKQWEKTYGLGGDDIGKKVHQLADGGYIMSGISQSYGPGIWNLWFFKTDSLGNKLWQKTYGTKGDDRFRYISPSKDGLIAWGVWDTVVHNTEDQFAALVMKLDPNGNEVWRTFYDHQKRRIIHQVRELDDGSIVAIGEQFRTAFTDSVTGWIAKLSAQGDVLWERFYPGKPDSLWRIKASFQGDFQQTPDGGFIIGGRIWKNTIPGVAISIAHAWIVKLDSNGCLSPTDCGLGTAVGIQEDISRELLAVSVFPNPAGEVANIYIKGNSSEWANEQIEISLYNLWGQQLHTETRLLNSSGYTEVQIKTSNLPTGVYVYSVTNDKDVLGNGKLVLK